MDENVNRDQAEERRKRLLQSYGNSGEHLARETQPGLLGLARRYGLDAAAARDVVQQAFQALFERRPSLTDVEAWLSRVVLRRVVDWRRREARLPQRLPGGTDPGPPVEALTPEQTLAVRTAVDSLPERLRLLVTLRCFEGCSETEAATRASYEPSSF